LKKIVLLETSEQVVDWFSQSQRFIGTTIIIALSPDAMYELEKNDVEFKVFEDYYKPVELYREQILNYSKVENLCQYLDKRIVECCRKVGSYSIQPAMFSIRYILTTYAVISTRMFQISKLISIEKPEEIIYYDTLKYPFGFNKSAPFISFDNRESVYSNLLSHINWGIVTKKMAMIGDGQVLISLNDEKFRTINFPSHFKKWLLNHPMCYSCLLNIQKNSFNNMWAVLKQIIPTARKPVLLYGAGYSWDDSISYLLKNNITPIYRTLEDSDVFNQMSIQKSEILDELWCDLVEDPKFRFFFTCNGFDFFPIVESRFKFLVLNLIPLCLIITKQTIERIKKQKIKAVIASTLATPIANSVACAAHTCNIPVVTWQHGGYGAMRNHPFITYLDLLNSDKHLVFGEGVKDSLVTEAIRFQTEVRVVGSMSLEMQIKEHSFDFSVQEKVILYATDLYLNNSQYISTDPPFSDVMLWQTQKQIINLLSTYKDYTILLKLHPSQKRNESLIAKYITDNDFENFKIIGLEQSFTELLKVTNAIILDRPFTTILQALVTNKPVFAFTGLVYYSETAQQFLSKRAICQQDISIFLFELNAYLSENKYSPDLNNNEFLVHYGHSLKKNSGESAVENLLEIIAEFETKDNEFN